MPTVTFTVRVRKAALLPTPVVHVGLDGDDDNDVGAGELTRAERDDDAFRCSFDVPSTAGRAWLVVVRAPRESTYTITAEADGQSVLAPVDGVVYPGTRGATIGQLS